MNNGTVGTFYNRSVSLVEFQRNARLLRLASQLGMRDLVQPLTAGAQTENDYYDKFSWNLMVLRHEADELALKRLERVRDVRVAVQLLQVERQALGRRHQ